MTDAPRLTADIDMVPHLKRAAATLSGRIFFPAGVRQHGPLVSAMLAADVAYMGGANGTELFIRDAGREAVDGPSMADLVAAEAARLSA